ncbi:MAG: hypothetical protein KAU90_12455, partial [Sulfurovaceae bacterium]|nr:hypothetical protein [Sulfurovaceae bacterium]
QIQSDTVFIKLSNTIHSNLTHWEKNYILNDPHRDYKNHGALKRYDTIEEFANDAPKRGYIPLYYVYADKMLLDITEELNVMEMVIDGDTNGDFKNLQDFRVEEYTDDEKAVVALVEHLNQKLTGGTLTKEETDIIANNIKKHRIFNKYIKNDPNAQGKTDESKYNKKKQLMYYAIFPAIRAVVTSSVYMTE